MEPNCVLLLSAARLRRYCKWFGFAFLIFWILFGSYGSTDHSVNNEWGRRSSISHSRRHLLSTDEENQCGDVNTTLNYEDCECSKIHDLDQAKYCTFVKNASSCGGEDGFIPYFEFAYCTMPYHLLPLSMILMAIWLMYLFLFLGITAEEFFCKSLTVITKILHLSQNVAGVTLLAFGNGAPDIFSVMAAFNHPDPKRTSLAFGALFGAGMYVTTIVVGLVVLVRPFTLTRRPFMRDNIFYLFAAYWALFMLWDNKMNVGVAVGFLVFYLGYVITVIAGSIIYQKWKNRRQEILQLSKTQNYKKHSRNESTTVRYHVTRTEPGGDGSGGITDLSTSRVLMMDTDIDQMSEEEKLLTVRRPTEAASVQPQTAVTTDAATGDVEKNLDKDDDDDEEVKRPSTPAERAASRASQSVYGTDAEQQDDTSTKEHELSGRPITPQSRSASRLEQVIDQVVYATEDIITGGNPNLAKVWHQAYQKEMETEKKSSPKFISAEEETQYESLSSSSDSNSNVSQSNGPATEGTSLLITRTPTFKERQVAALVRLLQALFPFGRAFLRMNILQKIFHIIKFPVSFFLILTIPLVDSNKPLNNWNRWLSILHCITAPLFFSLTTEFGLIPLGNSDVPAVIIVLFLGLILAVIVALTSSNDKPPRYHCVFAWAGFALSVVWIYTIANEIVNLLQLFGVVIKLSDGILGITLLAWGNSIQDTVTDLTMARQGFPKMAVGACFGGPLLNLLIGVGLASVVKIISEGVLEFQLYFTQVEMIATFFLLFNLSFSLVILSCFLGFRMYRAYSIILIAIYLVFLVTVILAELEVFNIQLDVLSPVN